MEIGIVFQKREDFLDFSSKYITKNREIRDQDTYSFVLNYENYENFVLLTCTESVVFDAVTPELRVTLK